MKGIIASDIDGTLLAPGETSLSPELFREIHRLTAKGYVFCPASGRQYHSLRRLFAPAADKLHFICENGAVVFGPGSSMLGKTIMPREEAEAISRDILAIDGCEVLISGENMSYVFPKSEPMVDYMRDVKGNHVTAVAGPEAVPEPIIKVSAYCPAGTGAIPPELAQRWAQFHPAVAGAEWLDFTLADKGSGLRTLCRSLGSSPDAVIAFGDNYNDIPMLELAGHAYLMDTAGPPLLAQFPNHCASVLNVLRSL